MKKTKKCKQCGVTSKNGMYEGASQKEKDNCQQCAFILDCVNATEIALNQPNYLGHTRKVKLMVKIKK